MYRMFPRSVSSPVVFMAAAIFWLASVSVVLVSSESTNLASNLASNFVVGEDGTTQAVPTNGSLHRRVDEIFLSEIVSDKESLHGSNQIEKFHRESQLSRFAWITNVLSDKLANFRPRSNRNPECTRQSDLYEQNLKNLTLWAMEMKDASTKSVEGLLFGQTAQLGNFDECVAVQNTAMTGRFCLASIEFAPTYRLYPNFYGRQLDGISLPPDSNAWESIKSSSHPARERRDVIEWSVCVPSACTWKDVEESLMETLGDVQKEHGIFVNVTLNERQCTSRADGEELPISAKLFSRLLLLLTAISVGVTVYHHILIGTKPYYQGGTFWKIMMGFSMVKSFRSLTYTSGDMNLNGLDGLKFISMVLIIYGHRLMFSLGSVISNGATYEPFYGFGSVTVISTQLVDSFFTISGFLVFWLMFPIFKKSGARIIPFTLFYRWLRVMPLYMMLIAFFVFLFPYVEEGPIWKSIVGREVERCQENWWTNLLVINNYVNTEKMCTVHGWYLACDLQMFLLGIFIVYAFSRSRSLGLKILLTALLMSWVLPFMDTYLNDYDGILRTYRKLLADPVGDSHYRDFYTKGHNRAAPYLLGILSGYLVVVFQENKLKLSMPMRWVTVLSIAVISEGSQMYGWNFYDMNREASLLEKSLYAAFHRSLWSLLPCFIIICHLVWGFGSSFEYILKHDFYVPMSRLTFGAFLVHPFLQLYTSASVRNPLYFTHSRMGWMGAGDIFGSYVIAFWLYCIIEAPAGNLSSMLKNKIQNKGRRTSRNKEMIVPTLVEQTEKMSSANGDYKMAANGDYKTSTTEISKMLPKDAVYFGIEDSEKRNGSIELTKEPVKENGSLNMNNSRFRNYAIKPEEIGNSPSVSDRPKELSDKLESMLTS